MSRVAKNPVKISSGVDVQLGKNIVVKGPKGQLDFEKSDLVSIEKKEDQLVFSIESGLDNKQIARAWEMAGTTRSIINGMVTGVSEGFEKILSLVGVGYRAKVQSNTVVLSLGYSHDINYDLPQGISVETPAPTEIIIKGIDKQKVGQVAAEIRSFRPPEPYKGKGVLYKGENLVRKEVRKKT